MLSFPKCYTCQSTSSLPLNWGLKWLWLCFENTSAIEVYCISRNSKTDVSWQAGELWFEVFLHANLLVSCWVLHVLDQHCSLLQECRAGGDQRSSPVWPGRSEIQPELHTSEESPQADAHCNRAIDLNINSN